jgi:hypothetical protein
MGFELVFAVKDGPEEGVAAGDVATIRGWAAFSDWASQLPDDYPEAVQLGEEGECSGIAELEAELRQALAGKDGKPSTEVVSVAKRLLTLLSERPEGAEGFVITDGG